jgi:NAD(P)-dependent dehydrogenase (short-subunit alcohol dehydrogenase family)
LSAVAEAFNKTKGTFGTIDIVINNAAVIGEDKWETEIEVNVVRNELTYIICKTVRKVSHYERIHERMSCCAELGEVDSRPKIFIAIFDCFSWSLFAALNEDCS